MKNERRGNWMQTAKGRKFWPLDPRPEEIFIDDIALHLGKICRFNGACKRFMSVGEHSVHVSELVPPEQALVALLHDATEAYLQDMIKPTKVNMPEFQKVEHGIWIAMAVRFDLPLELPPEVKAADEAMLAREVKDNMVSPPDVWSVNAEPADRKLLCLSPEHAPIWFAQRYRELTGETVDLTL